MLTLFAMITGAKTIQCMFEGQTKLTSRLKERGLLKVSDPYLFKRDMIGWGIRSPIPRSLPCFPRSLLIT